MARGTRKGYHRTWDTQLNLAGQYRTWDTQISPATLHEGGGSAADSYHGSAVDAGAGDVGEEGLRREEGVQTVQHAP
eukprot:2243299-Rhodomonas_salina.1